MNNYKCSHRTFIKLREHLLHASEFSTDEMEEILESLNLEKNDKRICRSCGEKVYSNEIADGLCENCLIAEATNPNQ